MRFPSQYVRWTQKKAANVKVKVHYLGLVKTYTGKTEDEFTLEAGYTLSDLLNRLAKEFGKQFTKDVYEPNAKDVKPTFSVAVNGVFIGQLNGLDTELKDGDNVILMPLVTGG